jgi:hypothetical protein
VLICFWFEGKNFNGIEQLIHAARQNQRISLGHSIPELSCNDDACCEQIAFFGREGGDLLRDLALRILQKVGENVRVEKIPSRH